MDDGCGVGECPGVGMAAPVVNQVKGTIRCVLWCCCWCCDAFYVGS